METSGVLAAAEKARRELKRLSRPAGDFDASRYFRGDHDLRFYNVPSPVVRAMAVSIVRGHPAWSLRDAMTFAETLIPNPVLEVKGIAVEVVARYRRGFGPLELRAWKRWLSKGYAGNWATTDAICGLLIGPLLLTHPALAPEMRRWSRHRGLWVRRASAVALVPSVRRGLQLDLGYDVAQALHAYREDLIQKAVGWLLRETGKTDMPRLDNYLRTNGPRIPRTTLRYAIERFPQPRRLRLLRDTRS